MKEPHIVLTRKKYELEFIDAKIETLIDRRADLAREIAELQDTVEGNK